MASKAKTYPEIRIPSPVTQTWLAYKENPVAMAALWGMACLLLVVIFGPSFVSYNPLQQDPNALLLPPSWAAHGTIVHFLGTDDLGRDLLTRLIYGARLTFGSAVVATLIAMLCGCAVGLLAGMSRGLT